jgi:hypothetical protein
MRERTHETAFDTIVFCSFFRSLFANARENARARQSIAFLIVRRGKHHPIGISLSPHECAFKRERETQEKHNKNNNKNTAPHHYSPNFGASLVGNDVQANGVRDSGLGNREHFKCVYLSE